MVETLAAEGVLAGQLGGLVVGRVADETDEVAVGFTEVLESLKVGRNLDDLALATL